MNQEQSTDGIQMVVVLLPCLVSRSHPLGLAFRVAPIRLPCWWRPGNTRIVVATEAGTAEGGEEESRAFEPSLFAVLHRLRRVCVGVRRRGSFAFIRGGWSCRHF